LKFAIETAPRLAAVPVAGPEKAENRPEMIEAIFADYKK